MRPRARRGGIAGPWTFLFLREDHDITEITDALQGEEVDLDTAFFEGASTMAPTMRAIATALRVFALVAALAGLIAIAQAVARMQQAAAEDDHTLAALGAGHRARWTRLAVPAGLAVLGGTALATLARRPGQHPVPGGRWRDGPSPDPGSTSTSGRSSLGGAVAALVGGAPGGGARDVAHPSIDRCASAT